MFISNKIIENSDWKGRLGQVSTTGKVKQGEIKTKLEMMVSYQI